MKTLAWLMARVVINEATQCWVWQKSRTEPEGYGCYQDKINDKWVTQYTHRLSWALHYGPIPVGLFVLHRCDIRPCCNPTHLFTGTQRDNIVDAYAKGRIARGDARSDTKLPDDVIMIVRQRYTMGESLRAIGREYGVSHSLLSLILSGKRRIHVR